MTSTPHAVGLVEIDCMHNSDNLRSVFFFFQRDVEMRVEMERGPSRGMANVSLYSLASIIVCCR